MKTILLWDPRFPDRRPTRLTVEDTVASAAVRAGVAAAANPAEAGALSAGGALDPTMMTEVVLQHGSGGSTRRVFLPYSVVMIGAVAGVLASIGTPIPGGLTPRPSPTLTISAAQSKAEGNSGATLFTYTVSRSSSVGAVAVPWSFTAGSTSADDFTGGVYPAGGNVNMADGVAAGTFTVSVNGDTVIEGDETFTVYISTPSGYVAGAATSATGTILNDDTSAPAPTYASVVGFGDSMTAGSAATTAANRFLNKFVAATGNGTLSNRGISSTVLQNSPDSTGSPRTDNGRDRFVSAMLGASLRSAALIEYGYNDARVADSPSTFNATLFANDLGEVISGLIVGGYPRADIYIATPFWITDSFLAAGASGFSAQTRSGFEAYVTATRTVAAEYGVKLADMYVAAFNRTDLLGSDGVHPNDAGHQLFCDTYLAAPLANSKARPVISSLVAGTGTATLSFSAPASGTVTSYTTQIGIEGSYAYGTPQTSAALKQTFSSLADGTYRLRVRANFSDGTSSPWEFASSIQVSNTVAPTVDPLTINSVAYSAGKFNQGVSSGKGFIPTTVLPTSPTLPVTLECFASTTATGLQIIAGQQRNNNGGWYFGSTGGKAVASTNNSGTSVDLTTTVVVNDGAFHHYALVLDTTGTRLYIDGVLAASNNVMFTSQNNSVPEFRNLFTYPWNGVTDELIITLGAKYTANFTPPTAPAGTGFGGTVYHMDGDLTGNK